MPDGKDRNSDLAAIVRASGLSQARVLEILESARSSLSPHSKRISVVENGIREPLLVTQLGVGPLTTRWGNFWKFSLNVSDRWSEYAAIVRAELDNGSRPQFRNNGRVLVRLDSGCSTGQVFGDLTCECREQLDLALAMIADEGEGLVICITRQDGRGMGLQFKLTTLKLQSALGLDNVTAAFLLSEGKPIDVRSYGGAIAVLKFLGISPPQLLGLMTNNPHKLAIFSENGFSYERRPLVIPATEQTERHLRAKQERLGHFELVPGAPGKVARKVEMKPKALLILGPSGAGKTTLIRRIMTLDNRFWPVRQYVTRALRPSESDKVQVSKAEFLALRDSRMLIGVNEIYGMMTGTFRADMEQALAAGRFPILDWPVSRLPEIANTFPDQLYRVYVEPPSLEVLLSRLNDGRDPNQERFKAAEEELNALRAGYFNHMIDYRIVNKNGEALLAAQAIYDHYLRDILSYELSTR